MPSHYCSAGAHYAGACPADEPETWVSIGDQEPQRRCHYALYPNPGYASCPDHAHLTPDHFWRETDGVLERLNPETGEWVVVPIDEDEDA